MKTGRPNKPGAALGLTLVEVVIILAVLAVLVLLIVLNIGRLGRKTPLSRRLVCASNLKGLGLSAKIYANDNREDWPAVGFDESLIGSIRYTVPAGGGAGTVQSPDRTMPVTGGPAGAREVSVTRAFWMLVRSGDVVPMQCICPSSNDQEDQTLNVMLYYDFAGPQHISYGYQVPFGVRQSRAREGMHNGMVLAADKGPYVDTSVSVPTNLTANSPLNSWQPFNSPNHAGEGQNALFADGHVSFMRLPLAGVDNDNIYTIALDNILPASRVIGESPWAHNAPPFTAFNAEGKCLGTTDSVIFP